MKILDLFGKKDVTQEVGKTLPYRIYAEFIPFKLYANRKSSTMLLLKVKNLTTEPVLGSVVVSVPRGIRLDETGLSAEKELKLGTLAASEEKEARANIYGDSGTDKGDYTLSITAFIHYRDYGHVLNAVRKKAILEVV